MRNTFERTHGISGEPHMGRRNAPLVMVLASFVLVVGLWAGWELYQGPTVTRQLKPGDEVSLVSNLGTATVPPRWSGRVTTVRSGFVPWIQFKLSRTLSKQVVELHSPDGSVAVTLDVVRGPGAYHARQSAATAKAPPGPFGMSAVQTVEASADDSYGGRALTSVADFPPPSTRQGLTVTVFAWDRSAPFVFTMRQRELLSGAPGSASQRAAFDVVSAGGRAFDFAPASR
jgi:hypothetical protein